MIDKVMKFLKSRQVRYGSYAVVATIVVIAIAVLLNAVIGIEAIRNRMRVDLTANKLYTIGDKTKKLLKNLNKEVIIYGLFDDTKINSSEYDQVTEFLKQYDTNSNKVTVKYIDPDKNPGFISSELDPKNVKGIKKGDFVVKSGNKMRILKIDDLFKKQFDQSSFSFYTTGSTAEQAFTGAIKYVSSDNAPVVYFVEGHGERNLDSEYTVVQDYLEWNNYEVKTINLLTSDNIPEDAAIIIFASPQSDISVEEADKIEDFLDNGGNVVFLFDALTNNILLANFEDLLSKYNVGLDYDMVMEKDPRRLINKQVPYDLVPDLQDNDITKNLNPNKFVMIMPKSRSLRVLKNDKEWIKVYSLLETSSSAIGKQIVEGKKDISGPLPLALAVDYKGGKKPSKVLVIGNGYFVTDSGMKKYEVYSRNGVYFFFNSLNWMQNKKDDIYIPQKRFSTPQLTMSALTANIIAAIVVILIPLIILGTGFFVWMRRKHL